MTESLKEVLAKVKQQREAERLKAKPVAKEEQEEEMQEEEPIEEEQPELPIIPAIPVKKPIFKPKPLPIQPQIAPQPVYVPQPMEMPKEEIKPIKSDAELIVEEIDLLHNNGIFRRELLVKLGQLNKNLAELNKMLGGV